MVFFLYNTYYPFSSTATIYFVSQNVSRNFSISKQKIFNITYNVTVKCFLSTVDRLNYLTAR